MTLTTLIKEYGFENVAEVERLGHIEERTLYNMFERKDPQLRVHLLGCWVAKCGGLDNG